MQNPTGQKLEGVILAGNADAHHAQIRVQVLADIPVRGSEITKIQVKFMMNCVSVTRLSSNVRSFSPLQPALRAAEYSHISHSARSEDANLDRGPFHHHPSNSIVRLKEEQRERRMALRQRRRAEPADRVKNA